ncbi:secretin N-terminal domain-containing protein [Pelagicoccus sp. SDUM812002]|uniref:secretin N-terminal domain-containing protein n=1 Tax=Pelagicoccus sp. SDUM812002 TaxID=3041266 RepID=UPI00280DF02D|nr:secretin N-terminal domain-containing protein [Pelagicoccus sp. SDUM812002]MDQ8187340.1 secretin N-terminal domain-containing protein [Pelagicoccus sp. SDUM812002]
MKKLITAILAIACAFGSASNLNAQDESLARVIPNPDEKVANYKVVDQELEGTLEILSEMTGRAVLRPQALPTPKITFDSGGEITVGELTLALESLLSLNGIGISPLGERFLKVVPLSEIRTQAPELVVESLAERPASGKVVSKLFRLQHLDSQTFQQQIQQFLSPGFSSIIPFQNSNAVIVTDTISNLQRLEYVVSEVDKPSRLNIEPAFYTLQFAQASEVAQQVQQMIEDARSRFGNETGGNSGRPNNAGTRNNAEEEASPTVVSGEGASISQILFGSNTAISADDRTNQIIIMTAPSNLKFFEDIIQKLDIKADPSTRMEVIPLKHADATEVASLLSQFVSGKTSGDTNDRTNSSANTDTRNNRRTGAGNPTFSNTNDASPINNVVRNNNQNASNPSTGEERDSQFSTFMTILADERSNALVISGTRSDLELMGALVGQIDVLLPQVRIEVIIAEVNLNESRGLNRGMDAFKIFYDEQVDGSGNVEIPGLGENEVPGLNILGLGVGGTFNYDDGVISNLSLTAIINQARTDSDVQLLSVPTLVTTHNKEAKIIEAVSYPIITSSQNSSISDTFRQSVQYQNIGIEMVVTPLIGPNDVIQLEIDQTIDDISGDVTIGGNVQPIISKRQATSYVSVSNGEMVVLGGLQKNKLDTGRSRAHLLGDIPLLGKLFRTKRKESTKSELMVFLRPQIIRTTDDVNTDAMKKLREMEGARAIEDFLRTGNVDVTQPREAPSEARSAKGKGD